MVISCYGMHDMLFYENRPIDMASTWIRKRWYALQLNRFYLNCELGNAFPYFAGMLLFQA